MIRRLFKNKLDSHSTVEHTDAAATRRTRFWKDTSGVAALEFALVAPIFFFTLFAVFEVGMTYTADAILQNGTNEAARRIRTGEIQMSGKSDGDLKKEFKASICASTSFMLDCDNVRVDVQRFANFGSAGFPDPLNGNGELKQDDQYAWQTGGPGDVIIVRAFYGWETVTPGLGQVLDNMPSGRHLIQATTAIRNEPYQGPIS